MRTRATAAAIAATLLTAALAGCSSHQPTKNEIAAACVKALAARADGDNAKPKECDGLSDDDYNTLEISGFLTGQGYVDKDGNVDTGKLLNPSSTP